MSEEEMSERDEYQEWSDEELIKDYEFDQTAFLAVMELGQHNARDLAPPP